MTAPAYSSTPFSEARITVIEGDQGSGKSGTAVARIRDKYDFDCVRLFFLGRYKKDVIVKSYDRKSRIAKIKYKGELKLIRIPNDYKLYSPLKIFSNIHLYGIPYVFCESFAQILFWLRQGVITHGFLLIDEAYTGMAARDSMSQLGKALNKQSMQFRKMQLEVVIITPIASLIDKYARAIPTEHILCKFNKKTHEVSLVIKKKGEKKVKNVTFDLRQYMMNYDTNERINQ